jgi:leader peptidase (prepilin peptidase) / N-methyltransferase
MDRALYFDDPFFGPLVQVYIFIIGAIVGSFLNVCIYRIPLDQSIVTPRSRCPKCGTLIPWYHNVPILSFVWLRGKCFQCGNPISPVYPFVEFLTAILFLLLYRYFGISVLFFIYAYFGCSIIVLIFVDYYHRLLPAVVTYPAILIGILSSFLNPYIGPKESLLGVLLGAGILLVVYFFYKFVRKKDGLGEGDIVMLAMVGAFLGWQNVLLVLFLSSLGGSLVGFVFIFFLKKGTDFLYPYGTFIGAAALPAIFWGEYVWNLYIL